MNLTHEIALLFAVATPIAVIFGMNLFLMLEGERGTLILPTWPVEEVEAPLGETPTAPVEKTPANEPHYPDYRRAA